MAKKDSNSNLFSIKNQLIIILLMIMAVLGYFYYVTNKNTNDIIRQANLRIIRESIKDYYRDLGFYPSQLEFGAPLTNCTGVNKSCTPTKTYLEKIPSDPIKGTATPYCYKSQVSSTNTHSCDNDKDKCGFFYIYGDLENTEGSLLSCDGVNNYDYELTPSIP